MAYTHNVTADNAVEILKDGNKVDTVGPWDSFVGANDWGAAVCDKYNAPEYASVDYPNELPIVEEVTNGNN